jgi:predicted acyl esterase
LRWLRKSAAAAAVILIGATACTGAQPAPSGAGPCAVTKSANVAVPMRDSTVLRADVYRPATAQPVPVILMRT